MIPDSDFDTVFLADLLPLRHPELCSQLISILTAHGIDVRWLADVQDIWARDYSPIQVNSTNFVHFRYEPDYLKGNPELRTGRQVVDCYRSLGKCQPSEINLDGGNLVTCGNLAIATDKIYRENPEWDREALRRELCRTLELDELIIVPKEPYDPIGHSDALVRFINQQTVLVNDYSTVDPNYGRRLTEELARHGLSFTTMPYFQAPQSHDGIPSAAGCFTNFLLTRHVLVAPIYQHPLDEEALRTLRGTFPDLPVVAIECTQLANEGGVLNCITAGARSR